MSDAADEVATLRAALAEKSRHLLQRERDVHVLLRRVHETNRWTERSAEIATRIASTASVTSAVGVFADALAEDLSFEYAVVVWRGVSEAAPSVPAASLPGVNALVAACHTAGPLRPCIMRWPDAPEGQLVAGVGFCVPDLDGADDAPVFVVGRTARTAMYVDDTLPESTAALSRLAAVVAQAFAAVRLNLALAAERDSLQVSVKVATAELRNALDVAERARADAVRAANARTEFLANMSHEIRTPMTAVLGYAELLEEPDIDEPRRREYLSAVRTGGRHLLQLLDDILELARAESGRLTLALAPASLARVVHEVVVMLAARATTKGLSLDEQLDPALPVHAVFDVARVRQVLINLVGNAVKFTASGGVTVSATARDGRFCIAVADTGVGIPSDRLSEIFDPFVQSDATTSHRYGGTGLGLAISVRLARLMGGDVAVESTPGVGSRFELVFPYTVPATPARPSAPSDAPGLRPNTPGHLLLAEDTAVNRVVVERFLTSAGHTVVTAADGREALEAVNARRPSGFDLILLDMQMPHVDGYEVVRTLRARGDTTPVVALTAFALAGDRDACLAAGCDDYLSKPVDRATLLQMVRRRMRHLSAEG